MYLVFDKQQSSLNWIHFLKNIESPLLSCEMVEFYESVFLVNKILSVSEKNVTKHVNCNILDIVFLIIATGSIANKNKLKTSRNRRTRTSLFK